MMMPETATQPTEIEPTAAQAARKAALRRFNIYFVYLPIALSGIVILLLVGLLIWGTLAPSITGTEAFVSGLADVVVIVWLLPLILLCLLGPASLIGLVAYFIRRQTQEPPPPPGFLQRSFWRLQNGLDKSQQPIENVGQRLAAPLIGLQGFIAYVETFFRNLFNR